MSRYLVHRIDSTAKRLTQYLKAHGMVVESLGQPVDAIGCRVGKVALLEFKSPRGKLRATQRAFIARWPGIVAVLATEADCDELLKRLAG